VKFSYRWLRELAGVGDDLDAAAAARLLTAAGMSVEGVEPVDGDEVLDVDVTTNRVDAMCHRGLARELAAAAGSALAPAAAEPEGARAAAPARLVTIAAPALCRRYVGIVVRGVRVGPSPGWLQRRLLALGLRPISNVVDVTNYVLWELGQPLHAFDLATLAEGRVVVREAREGERLRTLDGVERELAAGMLVIADAERAVALAGVMGGQDTEVGPATRDVLLESAWFDPLAVRRTARRLGMHTDASHRFERGVDPAGQLAAAERAAALLVELAGGREVTTAADVRGDELAPPAPIALGAARLDRFVGQAIPPPEVERLLTAVGFEVVAAPAAAAAEWAVTVPSWRRFDVFEEADVFEEVLRLHGYDAVAPALPAVGGPDAPEPPAHALRRRVRRQLAASGFAEAIDWAFYGAAEDARFATSGAAGPALALVNPLSERHTLMRRSLLPGLVEAASFNRRRGAAAARLFEVGHVFWRAEDGSPRESEQVAVVCGGRLGAPWERPVEVDLFDLKGALEALAGDLGRRLVARPAAVTGFAPGRSATLHLEGGEEAIGIIGQVDEPEGAFPLLAAEVATTPFLPLPAPPRVVPPSRFPAIAVDLTLTHALDVPWAALAAMVEERRPPELASFGLENRYQGAGVPAGAVNTTIHFVYNAADRSLTQEEVNERHRELAAALVERFGWPSPQT
jgi:phenylalanyl-tRNA synthetase beta chain